MHGRVAINLTRGGLQNARAGALGEPQHVDGAVHAGLGGLHGIALIVNGRSGAGEVVDLVDLHVERERHVVAHQLEVGPVEQVPHVVAPSREVVVDAQHLVAGRDQTLAEEAANEPCTAGDENSPGIE